MNKNWLAWGLAGALGLMLLGGGLTVTGVLIGMNWSRPVSLPMALHADTASRAEDVSFATGLVANETEGLFILDHQTGLLQCWVVNRQTGQVGALYLADPAADMELEKASDGDYVMTTGLINFIGNFQVGNERPASCICYVGDGNSGKVLGYSFRLNQQGINQGVVQQGEMVVVCRGLIRESSMIRDQ